MSYEITGRIAIIGDLIEFDSGFQKLEFVVEEDAEKYPQVIKLELLKDKVSELDGLQVGDSVTVKFNIRGNEYNGKYYVNLVAWKIESEDRRKAEFPPLPPSLQPESEQLDKMDPGEDAADIPF
jgi:hypothetical protein